jgi:hypothetical protein
MTGTSTSLKSLPDHRMAEIVSDTEPAGMSVASSSQAIGDAPVTGATAAVGSALPLGGALLCPLL